jgi:hypothetical protein
MYIILTFVSIRIAEVRAGDVVVIICQFRVHRFGGWDNGPTRVTAAP